MVSPKRRLLKGCSSQRRSVALVGFSAAFCWSSLGTKPQRIAPAEEYRTAKKQDKQRQTEGEKYMLRWAAIFFVIALIAALLGFTGIAGAAAAIAKFLFFLFVVIFLVLLLMGLFAGRKL